MKQVTVEKAYHQIAHIRDLKTRRKDLKGEWMRLLCLRAPRKLKAGETLPILIAVGGHSGRSDSTRLRPIEVPMTECVFDAILARVDNEIMIAEVRLEEMGVED